VEFVKTWFPGTEADLTVRTVEGVLDMEIVDVAINQGSTLIVTGSHGRREIDRVVLGSAAEKIVRHGPISATVV